MKRKLVYIFLVITCVILMGCGENKIGTNEETPVIDETVGTEQKPDNIEEAPDEKETDVISKEIDAMKKDIESHKDSDDIRGKLATLTSLYCQQKFNRKFECLSLGSDTHYPEYKIVKLRDSDGVVFEAFINSVNLEYSGDEYLDRVVDKMIRDGIGESIEKIASSYVIDIDYKYWGYDERDKEYTGGEIDIIEVLKRREDMNIIASVYFVPQKNLDFYSLYDKLYNTYTFIPNWHKDDYDNIGMMLWLAPASEELVAKAREDFANKGFVPIESTPDLEDGYIWINYNNDGTIADSNEDFVLNVNKFMEARQ